MSGQDYAEELSGGDDPEVELEDVGALVVGPPAAVSNPRRPLAPLKMIKFLLQLGIRINILLAPSGIHHKRIELICWR